MTTRPAVIAPDGAFTYADLDRAASRVAGALAGGRADLDGDRVAFLSRPGFAHVAVARGIWRAGGVAVPLALSHPPAELEYVIRDAEASTVVVDDALAGGIEAMTRGPGPRVFTTEAALNGTPIARRPAIDPNRPALIVYTSGTTARPKGVVTTHANVSAQIASLVAAWEWTTADRTLLVLPLHHVHGIINVVGCALDARATLEILSPFDAELTWARLASGEITVFTAVPTIYHRLIQSWEAASSAIQQRRSAGCRAARLMMSGSAALPVNILERWKAISGHTLLERYGMTEIGMALSNPLHGERRAGYVGVPLPGVQVQIVDETGSVAPDDAPGELEVRGPAVFAAYWRRPEETRRAFRDGWFRTGDIAARERGAYRLLGRTSVDIIKTGGYKISALEIEEIVREHPSVADCAVVGVADAEWGERVCAAVEVRPGASLGLDDVQGWTRARLAPYKVPRALQCVLSLPRNAMGKVVKAEVAKLF